MAQWQLLLISMRSSLLLASVWTDLLSASIPRDPLYQWCRSSVMDWLSRWVWSWVFSFSGKGWGSRVKIFLATLRNKTHTYTHTNGKQLGQSFKVIDVFTETNYPWVVEMLPFPHGNFIRHDFIPQHRQPKLHLNCMAYLVGLQGMRKPLMHWSM